MLPECGIPVCIVNCKFASVQQLRVEFAKSRGDAPVLVYGRLVYKSAAMGLKRASVLVPAKASAEWDAPELSSCSSPAIGKDKLLKPVLWSSLTVTGFVQLAAETAGADSEIGNELLIAATRKTGPRQVIRLCSSLQSLGEFEREHAVNFNLSPSSQNSICCKSDNQLSLLEDGIPSETSKVCTRFTFFLSSYLSSLLF